MAPGRITHLHKSREFHSLLPFGIDSSRAGISLRENLGDPRTRTPARFLNMSPPYGPKSVEVGFPDVGLVMDVPVVPEISPDE
ncbi:hypothetical protein HPB47_011948 [Ixodes persulcatus]|uniref:Uncharacterized protein n=1 Tax=Ixodes persulcatus TaxID=34615 RepID=A0AC60NV02_IXOPE|nr:hypothetical protein HPB47_011948 [Ixodes persulcatus]